MNTSIWWLVIAIAVAIVAAIVAYRAKLPRRGLLRGVTVHYTKHAKQRMHERVVSAAQVEAVLADPARAVDDPREQSVRLERVFDDRILKVWVVAPWPPEGEITIKTTAWNDMTTLAVPSTSLGRVIGRGGATIERIRERTGAHIKVNNDGTISISGHDQPTLAAARHEILAIAGDPQAHLGSTITQKEGESMAKNSKYGNPGKFGSNSRDVSSARLHQKSGSSNAFGGYTKVNNTDGTFRMRKSG